MSWWVKSLSIILFVGAVFTACKEDLGLELPPDAQRTEVKVIEFTLPAKNVYFDSLITSNTNNLFVGEYTDPVYGNMYAEGYSEFFYKEGATVFEEIEFSKISNEDTSNFIIRNPSFDSFDGSLRITQLLAENIESQSFNIFSLADTLYGDVLYFSNRKFPTNQLIGSGTSSLGITDPGSFESDTIVVDFRITNEEYGNSIFEAFQREESRFTGIGITPETSNSIFQFDLSSDTSQLIMNINAQIYEVEGIVETYLRDTTLTTNFQFTPALSYSYIENTFTGTEFEGISDGDVIDVNEDNVFLNQLAGIYPTIDISPFFAFSENTNEFFINRGELELQSVENELFTPNIESLNPYFGQEVGDKFSVNWGSLSAQEAFGLYMLTDNTYVGLSSSPVRQIFEYDTLVNNENTGFGYQAFPTFFWQILFNNVKSEIAGEELEDLEFVNQELFGVRNLVFIDPTSISLGRNTLIKDGIKLKLYYTTIN